MKSCPNADFKVDFSNFTFVGGSSEHFATTPLIKKNIQFTSGKETATSKKSLLFPFVYKLVL